MSKIEIVRATNLCSASVGQWLHAENSDGDKINIYSSGQHNLYRKKVQKQPYSLFLFIMKNPIKPKYHEAAIGKALKLGIFRVILR